MRTGLGDHLGGSEKSWGISLWNGDKITNEEWDECLGPLSDGDLVTIIIDRDINCLYAQKNDGPVVLAFDYLTRDLYFACCMGLTDSCLELVEN